MRRTLLRLTEPGEGTEDTRRRASLAELESGSDSGDEVLRRLVDAHLLTTSRDEASGAELVEVAHEALIRGWPTLRAWIDEGRAGLRVQRRITEATQEWETLGHDPGALYRGARLAEALEWRAANEESLNTLERAFLDASDAAQRSELEQARRRTRRLRALAGALAVLPLAAVAAAVYAVQQTDEANAQRDQATAQKRVATSRALAAAATANSATAPALALPLGYEPCALRRRVGAELRRPQRRAVTLQRNSRLLAVVDASATAVALSPDGRLLATGGADGDVTVWDVTRRPRRFAGHVPETVVQLAFSSDGRLLAAASTSIDPDTGAGMSIAKLYDTDPPRPGAVFLWDLQAPRAPAIRLAKLTNPAGLAFGRGDHTLAASGTACCYGTSPAATRSRRPGGSHSPRSQPATATRTAWRSAATGERSRA